MEHLYLIFAIVIALACVAVYRLVPYYYSKRDIKIQADQKRPGILFGYYGVHGNQVEETRGHVNLQWVTCWEGTAQFIRNIVTGGVPCILDVGFFMTQRGADNLSYVRLDAGERLRTLIDEIRKAGGLHLIAGFTPGDEPNSQFASVDEWNTACSIIQEVATSFRGMPNFVFAMLLDGHNTSTMEHWVRHGTADWVGFDRYSSKSSIFQRRAFLRKTGLFIEMLEWLGPHQRTFIVPGASEGQDPAPFVAYANNDPRVVAIVTFLWANIPIVGGTSAARGLMANPELRVKYEEAGREITGLRR